MSQNLRSDKSDNDSDIKLPKSKLGASGEKSNNTANYGARNRIVTQDRAAELRQKLKGKLNRLNSGVDPEVLAIGAELTIYHIEAGARRFQDFAKAIAADLDMPVENLRKYLRGWYNSARDMMEDMGENVVGTDSPDDVAASMRRFADWSSTNADVLLIQMTMQFMEPYLIAMRKNAPAMYQRLKATGALVPHLEAKTKEAHDLYRQLTEAEEKYPNGLVRSLQAHSEAERTVMETLIEFPQEDAVTPA
jgi:hypothetical protein